MLYARVHKLATSNLGRSLILMKIRGTSLVVKFLLTLFVAKFLSFEDLGLYGLISASAIVAPVLLGLCLMASVSRRAVTQSLEKTTESIRHYGIYLGLVYSVLLIASLSYGGYSDRITLALLIWVIILFEHINFDAYGLLLNLSKPMTANIMHFIRSAGWALLYMGSAFFIPDLRNIETLLIYWSIGSFISFSGLLVIARDWPWKKNNPNKSLKKWIRNEFGQSRIMYYNSVLETGSTYISHFIISIFLGLELTGVYVFFFQVISAMSNLLQTGIIQIARPKLLKAYHEKNSHYKQIWTTCLKLSSISASLMSLTAIPALYIVINIMAKPLAIEWFYIFPIMLIGFILNIVFQANRLVFYSQHKDKINLYMFAISLFMLIICELFLIQFVSLWGVAVAFIISQIITAVMSFNSAKKIV